MKEGEGELTPLAGSEEVKIAYPNVGSATEEKTGSAAGTQRREGW